MFFLNPFYYVFLFVVSVLVIFKKSFEKPMETVQKEQVLIEDVLDDLIEGNVQVDESEEQLETNHDGDNEQDDEDCCCQDIDNGEYINCDDEDSDSDTSNLSDNYVDLSHEYEKLNDEYNKLLYKYNNLKNKYRNIKHYTKSYIEETSTEINLLDKQNEFLVDRNKYLLSENSILKDDLNGYEKQFDRYLNDNDLLKQKIVDLEADLWTLNEENIKNNNLIKILNEEITEKKIEIIKLRKQK